MSSFNVGMPMMGCGFGGKLVFIWSLVVTGSVDVILSRSLYFRKKDDCFLYRRYVELLSESTVYVWELLLQGTFCII